jgi:hypothetical protein
VQPPLMEAVGEVACFGHRTFHDLAGGSVQARLTDSSAAHPRGGLRWRRAAGGGDYQRHH